MVATDPLKAFKWHNWFWISRADFVACSLVDSERMDEWTGMDNNKMDSERMDSRRMDMGQDSLFKTKSMGEPS